MVRPRMALFLSAIMVLMTMVPVISGTIVSTGNSLEVIIGSGPDGVSREFEIEVPDGEIIRSLDLSMTPSIWPIDSVYSFETKTDFNHPDAVMDGADTNLTGLRILPMSHEWDFEASSHGWTLDASGGWAHGTDAAHGAHSGSKAIYTYNGNYPNYMGGPYWATSPSVDCTSCSGSWNLKFWRLLGVESASYDHAYVQVKGSNNAWTNIYSNPYGTTSDSSYNQQTYDVSNYITGNPSFQVRFGLGSSDGSITYTGWNVDDVLLEPSGNTGSGTANWTSPAMGPGAVGELAVPHGLMSIDAEVPPGGHMQWTLMDAATMTPISGFIDRLEHSADLSILDPEVYPEVKLKIMIEATSATPVIHSIRFGGSIVEGFHVDPTSKGWSGHSSQSGSSASGTGIMTSPLWTSSHPFSRVNFLWDGTGTGNLESSFDGGNWVSVPKSGLHSLDRAATTLQVRWTGGGSWNVDSFSAELHEDSAPHSPKIDIGLDGVSEWSLANPSIGPWGLQNIFMDGNSSQQFNLAPSVSDYSSFYVPMSGISDLRLGLVSQGSSVDGVSIDLEVDGITEFSKNLGTVDQPVFVELTNTELSSLLQSISNSNYDLSTGEIEFKKIDVKVTSTVGGALILGSLSIPWQSDVSIKADGSDSLVKSLNTELSSITAVNGFKKVALPVRMANAGSMVISLDDIQTSGSPLPVSLMMNNSTDTLVAGNDWYEFTTVFDLNSMGINDAQQHILSENWGVSLSLDGTAWSKSVSCSIPSGACTAEQGIILDSFSYTFSGSQIEYHHRLRISSIWPDEPALVVNSAIDMAGVLSSSASMLFGLGLDMGVEQDIDVVDWYISSMEGVRTTWDALYFDPNFNGTVNVELAFENLEDSPRSGAYSVSLVMDGFLVDQTSILIDGIAQLHFTPNMLASQLELEIDVQSLSEGDVNWLVPKNATFEADDKGPILLSSNVEYLDHRSLDAPLKLIFNIGDRPVLPRHAKAHLVSSWGEEEVVDLELPLDLDNYQGDYLLEWDISAAVEGDLLSGWLEVADSAGHIMADSGSQFEPLFTIRFGDDGPPEISENGLGWVSQSTWLHPGQLYSLEIPISDINGYGDISEIEIDLSSDSEEELEISWSSQNGCISSTSTIIIENCEIIGDAEQFDSMFTLGVDISLDWSFNPDTSVERSVSITASDNSGQSHSHSLDSIWRYSSEIEIDTDSAIFENTSSFVPPSTITNLFADVIWTRSGQPVNLTLDVVASIDGSQQYGLASEGIALLPITSPNSTGFYAITLDVANLPLGGIDRTDDTAIVAWMVVDSHAPRIIEMLSPSTVDLIQERDWKDMQFDIMINESQGLNIESLRMHWILMPSGRTLPELALLGGNSSMELIAGTGSGNSIPVTATVDVESLIPEVSRNTEWDLWVWVTGEDLAGQQIDDSFNSRNSPLGVIKLASRQPNLVINSEDIVLLNQQPNVDSILLLNMTIHNTGEVDGSSSVRIEVVESGQNRRLLEVVNVLVPGNNSTIVQVKWIPENSGAAWVEVSMPDGTFARTEPIQISEGETTFIIDGMEGADSSMLFGFSIIAILMIITLGYLLVSGKKNQDEYDESDYL